MKAYVLDAGALRDPRPYLRQPDKVPALARAREYRPLRFRGSFGLELPEEIERSAAKRAKLRAGLCVLEAHATPHTVNYLPLERKAFHAAKAGEQQEADGLQPRLVLALGFRLAHRLAKSRDRFSDEG